MCWQQVFENFFLASSDNMELSVLYILHVFLKGNHFVLYLIYPVSWGGEYCNSAERVTYWQPIMNEGWILIVEQSITWVLSGHVICNTPLQPLLDGQMERLDPIYQMVMTGPLLLYKSQPYSSDCSDGKLTANSFHLKVARRQWLRIHYIKTELWPLFNLKALSFEYWKPGNIYLQTIRLQIVHAHTHIHIIWC